MKHTVEKTVFSRGFRNFLAVVAVLGTFFWLLLWCINWFTPKEPPLGITTEMAIAAENRMLEAENKLAEANLKLTEANSKLAEAENKFQESQQLRDEAKSLRDEAVGLLEKTESKANDAIGSIDNFVANFGDKVEAAGGAGQIAKDTLGSMKQGVLDLFAIVQDLAIDPDP